MNLKMAILLSVGSFLLIVLIFLVGSACDLPLSPTDPEPFARPITVAFSCDGVSASGAVIQLNADDGVCRFQCVDLTTGGREPYNYSWQSDLGESHQRSPIFETSDSLTFDVSLHVTDRKNNTDEENKFFVISCL